MPDDIINIASILESEGRRYDSIALFSNQTSTLKDSLQITVGRFFDSVRYIEWDKKETEAIDAVQCASLILNSITEDSKMSVTCCTIKRDKRLIHKIIGHFDSKSVRVNVEK
jgi:hypothetical protein